jgi:REP element-mobilizing transposase RayT
MAGKEFQLSLFNMKSKKIFGGSLLKGSNPKEKRPVSTKHPMHIVLRSSHTNGGRSFLVKRNSTVIDRIVKNQITRWGLRLYRYENVGNHIHLLVKTTHRAHLKGFLRSMTGLIARHVLGAERGSGKFVKFWCARPFSRIVSWGREYRSVLNYFEKNQLQALGFDLSALARELDATRPNSS